MYFHFTFWLPKTCENPGGSGPQNLTFKDQCCPSWHASPGMAAPLRRAKHCEMAGGKGGSFSGSRIRTKVVAKHKDTKVSFWVDDCKAVGMLKPLIRGLAHQPVLLGASHLTQWD